MIVDYFKSVVEGYNEIKKCGFCWDYVYGRHDYTNLLPKGGCKKGCDCCVKFLLEKYSKNVVYKVYDEDGSSEKAYTDYYFEVFVGMESDFTLVYHGCEDSKYEKYLKPLCSCLESFFEVDLCGQTQPIALLSYRMNEKINYKDQNYDGFFIKGTIRRWWM